MKEVVRKEVIKWLHVGIIYPVSNSSWKFKQSHSEGLFPIAFYGSDVRPTGRKCVAKSEICEILYHCHSSPSGGHFGGSRTVVKILQVGFFLPIMLNDVYEYVRNSDKCQRTGNISKSNKMPLTNIIEVELFDVWGIDFLGLFPSSYGKIYILVVVDYVSKWVEAQAYPKNDAKVVTRFLHKHAFTRFRTLRAIISDHTL
ncbi:hypothetical protein CXB51_036871 [Gossypium anomalum]|uniref:Integrase catalytic domain-containing protein n=1 Tax=Gossypium anomalum TaxID=47600 RepID=A0A8J5XTE5_9ROSI|nr:hypothetical protein CXB51_036871 [Gossypium anomalum]